jgi:hypothetical protein
MELRVLKTGKQGEGLSAATSVLEIVIACLDKDRNCCLNQYRKHCAYLASIKPLYVFVACYDSGHRVAEPQVPCHSRTHSSEVEWDVGDRCRKGE